MSNSRLILRPDDIWNSIMLELVDYVCKNTNSMITNPILATRRLCQGRFTVDMPSRTNDWTSTIEKLMTDVNIAYLPDWVLPDFTTTTANDRIIVSSTVTGTLKRYYENTRFASNCGLSSVTLEGSHEDWYLLLCKINQLLLFGDTQLEYWHRALAGVINRLVQTSEYIELPSELNEWWQCCCVGAENGVSGWAVVFSPFYDGKWCLYRPESFECTVGKYGVIHHVSSLVTETPIRVNDIVFEFNACVYAGMFAPKHDNTVHMSFDFMLGYEDECAAGACTHPATGRVETFKSSPNAVKFDIPIQHPFANRVVPPPTAECVDFLTAPIGDAFGGRILAKVTRHHPHAIIQHAYPANMCVSCDVCAKSPILHGYECRECNFDCCVLCFDR